MIPEESEFEISFVTNLTHFSGKDGQDGQVVSDRNSGNVTFQPFLRTMGYTDDVLSFKLKELMSVSYL